MKQKPVHIAYIVLFVCMLLTPAVLWIAGVKDPMPFTENRRKAALPDFNINSLHKYPVRLDSFFNDTFPFRNTMVFESNYINVRYFKKSAVPDRVLLGSDDWMYNLDEAYEFYTGRRKFSEEELAKMAAEITDRGEKCKAAGAEYRIVIIPSKINMYPEYLPLWVKQDKAGNMAAQTISYLQQHTPVKITYLLDSLQAAKKHGILYRKGDTHWNEWGMYYGYRAIASWLKKDYPYIRVEAPEEFMFTDSMCYTGDLIQMMGLTSVWPSPNAFIIPKKASTVINREKVNYPCDNDWFGNCYAYEEARINTADSTLPGLLATRDSYTNYRLMELLGQHFTRSTFIWDYWQHKLNPAILANEKPKVVLCLMSERFLENFLKYPNAQEPGGMNRMEPVNRK